MENKEQFEFITEKVKDRPLNKRRLIRRTLITVSMAVIFGIIACLSFSVFEPVINNWLHPQEEMEPIEIPIDVEEILPEDMLVHEEDKEPSQEVIETIKDEIEIQLGTVDYKNLYREIYTLVKNLETAKVTVTIVSDETDWFNTPYENQGQTEGYIFVQTDTDIMIMTDAEIVGENERFEVTFSDGKKAAAEIRGTDVNTGLAVLDVKKYALTADTLEAVTTLNLGSSGTGALLASPVIAVGSPLGKPSVAYGMVTSMETVVQMADANYRVLNTDIYGSRNAKGLLLDLDGRVIGILNQKHNENDMGNLISALGITEVKFALQRMSNGLENNYLGLLAINIPAELAVEKEVSGGAYVTGIMMDSPAMQAGIQSGDIIINLGKEEIVNFSDYQRVLSECAPEEVKEMILLRQGQEGYKAVEVEVVIGRLE